VVQPGNPTPHCQTRIVLSQPDGESSPKSLVIMMNAHPNGPNQPPTPSKRPFSATNFASEDGDGNRDLNRPRKHFAQSSHSHGTLPQAQTSPNTSMPGWRNLIQESLRLPNDIDDYELQVALFQRLSNGPTPASAPASKSAGSVTPKPPKPKPAMFGLLHRVLCYNCPNQTHTSQVPVPPQCQTRMYIDEPCLISVDTANVSHLAGRQEITDVAKHAYRLQSEGTCHFIVIWEYHCCDAKLLPNPLGQLSVSEETIYCVTRAFCSAFMEFQSREAVLEEEPMFPDVKRSTELHNLHYWLYHQQDALMDFAAKAEGESREALDCLQSYIRRVKVKEYTEVSKFLKEGKIVRQYLRYLFVSPLPATSPPSTSTF